MKLHYEIMEIGLLDTARRNEMYALFETCYLHVTRAAFESDLSSKTLAILLLDDKQELMGFSTQEIYRSTTRDGLAIILFSGDTIITPSCWGSQELVKGWCEVAANMLDNAAGIPCYWFLISKGYRTYLYLPLFFKIYHPHHDGSGKELVEILNDLAEKKFPGCFDRDSGLIRFPVCRGQLGDDLKGIPHHRDQNCDVRFFLEKNPDYVDGVELACLAPITIDNTRGWGKRMLGQAMRRTP